MRRQHLQHLRKDFRIAGQHIAGFQIVFIAGNVGSQTTGPLQLVKAP